MIKIANLAVDNHLPFVLIAGPCQIESLEHAQEMADKLKMISLTTSVDIIYKSSFDKANRTSGDSPRGVGLHEGLMILEHVAKQFELPVLTDVHEVSQVKSVAQVVDVIQIPAFLCRQTDLLVEAATQASIYSRAVNIKKGQFLAPWDMHEVTKKFTSVGFDQLMLCERGTTFGYNRLVNDFTSIPQMQELGFPVIYDATHSVQMPGGQGTSSGGNRRFVAGLSKAALAMGCAGLFLETHEDPDNAPSDGPNMIPVDQLQDLLWQLKEFDRLSKSY